MRSWFNRRRAAPDPLPESELAAADPDSTRAAVEHDAAIRDTAAHKSADRALREAYDRGRRDERARRPAFSLVSVAVLMAAIVGGGALYLAVKEGSFSQGGAVVDHSLSSASDKVQAPVRGAADRAGSALEHAGQNLKEKAGTPGTGDQASR